MGFGSTHVSKLAAVLAGLVMVMKGSNAPSAPLPLSASIEARAKALVAQMTLEEKLGLIKGSPEAVSTNQGQAGWIAGVPRLGIPGLRLADGPPGVLTREVSAAPPSTLAIAATFSVKDAEAVGAVIGRNARARGIDVVLEPFINMYRDQTFHRASNTHGEDPLLTGSIGAAIITGIQSQNVMAQAKHFVVYEGSDDAIVGEQAFREIYLEPFRYAVEAGVTSVMCSYNRINGIHACGNNGAQNEALRRDLGFQGFITSDWGAAHGAEYINAGLDMLMPGQVSGPIAAFMPDFFSLSDSKLQAAAGDAPLPGGLFGEDGSIPEETPRPDSKPAGMRRAPELLGAGQSPSLGVAMKAGTVKEETIDQAAMRVLEQMIRFGYLDGKQKHSVTPEPIGQNAPLLEKVAADAAVLLKNDGALPLKASELNGVVLIGPGARQNFAVVASGEKALGWPDRQIGALEAIHRRTGQSVGFEVATDLAGEVIPEEALSSQGQHGLIRTSADPSTNNLDTTVNFTLGNGKAFPVGSSYEWDGTLQIPSDGEYDIHLQLLGAAGLFEIDGKRAGGTASLHLHGDVLQAGQDDVIPTPDHLDNVRRRLSLTKGPHPIRIKIDADTSGQPVQVRLAWVTPEKRAADRAAALAAAKRAAKVVFFAWGRGRPDNFALPGDQDALIDEIATINPHTIVVLNLADPVAMPWLSKVEGILQMWYSGDEGGWATADLLMGRRSPAGRLPITWPKELRDTVANDPTHPERATQTASGKTEYSEGIYVGYRWFDQRGIEPLYPFGYGLSYSSFEYSDLNLSTAPDGGLEVKFQITNKGSVASDEVPQIYLGAPQGENPSAQFAQFAQRALIAFDRVSLKAGERRRVLLHVPIRKLQYWSAEEHMWRTPSGARDIWVGTSSRDLRLTGSTTP